MTKLFKNIIKCLMGLLLVIIVAMLGIFTFVNPNQFKDLLEKQALLQTGHVLSIQGPLNWKWSPMLSLELKNVHFKALPPSTTKLFSAESIQTELNLGSIFLGKILLNLKLDGLDLIYNRYKNSTNNWTSLIQKFENSKTSEDKTKKGSSITSEEKPKNTPSITSKEKQKKGPSIMVTGIEISKGQVHVSDELNANQYKIDELDLSAKKLMNGLIGASQPISLSLRLEKNKQLVGKLDFSCDCILKYLERQLNLENTQLKFESPEGHQTLLTGEVMVQNFDTAPKAQGKINGKHFDIHSLLSAFKINASDSIPAIEDVNANFQYSGSNLSISALAINLKNRGQLNLSLEADLSKVSPTQFSFEGNFKGSKLPVGKFQIEEIKGDFHGKDGLITCNPILFTLDKSQHTADLNIDLRGAELKFVLNEEGKNLELKPLLAKFGIQNKIEGKTNIKLKLVTSGNTADKLKRNLSGQTQVEVSNGKFYGADLITLLKNTQTGLHNMLEQFTKKQKFNLDSSFKLTKEIWDKKPSPDSFTPFDSIQATVSLATGIAKNTDLSISHTEYKISGSGVVNFIEGSVQYQTSVLLNKNPYPSTDEIGNYLYKTSLPVKITGNFANLGIVPDIKTYTNQAIVYAEKKFAEDLLQKTVGSSVKKLLNKSGDNQTGDSPAGVNPSQELLDNTLNKFLNNVQGFKP